MGREYMMALGHYRKNRSRKNNLKCIVKSYKMLLMLWHFVNENKQKTHCLPKRKKGYIPILSFGEAKQCR
jgi:hypothetical protein